MSEHWSIEGNVVYWHLPFGEFGGSTWCNHCKKTCEKIIVSFDEGFGSSSITFYCGKCKKAIVVFHPLDERNITFVKDDEKCSVCGKKTNKTDAVCFGFKARGDLRHKAKNFIYCSKKCYEKAEKR
jgi:hypothetical protein